MASDTLSVDEPRLTIRRDPVGGPARQRLLAAFLALCLAAAGTAILLYTGNATLPFRRIVTVEAMIASKSEYFHDPEVKRLLLRHGLRVHLTTRGSLDLARQDFTGQDFVFPSGAPAADVILEGLARRGRSTSLPKPFTTPLVLASFREYAEALRTAGVATPLGEAEPYFYRLDMAAFLDLIERRTRWRDIGPIASANRVTAFTPDICEANSAATYMALVAFVRNGYDVPHTPTEATALANSVAPLVSVFGQASEDLFIQYKTPEGKGTPIVAVYENQFLSYQLEHRVHTGQLDRERVLMYPSVAVRTEPVLIPLTPRGERVGELLMGDPDLRRRATELAFRLTSRGPGPDRDELADHLRANGVPAPTAGQGGGTTLLLPRQELLERMIEITGGCRW